MTRRTRPRAVVVPKLDRALIGAAAALFVLINVFGAVQSRELDQDLSREAEQDVLIEEHDACERLGAPPGSERFLPCIEEFDKVRLHAREWSDAEHPDLL